MICVSFNNEIWKMIGFTESSNQHRNFERSRWKYRIEWHSGNNRGWTARRKWDTNTNEILFVENESFTYFGFYWQVLRLIWRHWICIIHTWLMVPKITRKKMKTKLFTQLYWRRQNQLPFQPMNPNLKIRLSFNLVHQIR